MGDHQRFSISAVAPFSQHAFNIAQTATTAEDFLVAVRALHEMAERPAANQPSILEPVMKPITNPVALRDMLFLLHARANHPEFLVVVGDEPVWLSMNRLKEERPAALAWLVPFPGTLVVGVPRGMGFVWGVCARGVWVVVLVCFFYSLVVRAVLPRVVGFNNRLGILVTSCL